MVTIKCHFGAERHGARHQAPCLYLVMMEMKCQNSGTVSSYVVSVMQWRWLWLQQSGCWQISFGSRDVKVKGVLWRRQRRMKCLMIEFWVWVRVFKYTNRHYIFNWADVNLERASMYDGASICGDCELQICELNFIRCSSWSFVFQILLQQPSLAYR